MFQWLGIQIKGMAIDLNVTERFSRYPIEGMIVLILVKDGVATTGAAEHVRDRPRLDAPFRSAQDSLAAGLTQAVKSEPISGDRQSNGT